MSIIIALLFVFVGVSNSWLTFGHQARDVHFGPTNIPTWNYMKTVPYRPENWHFPTNVSQIQAIVNSVRAKKGNIKVVGAGHSWVASTSATHTMIGLDLMPQNITFETCNGGKPCFRAPAGIRLIDLLEFMWDYNSGYTMSQLGWCKAFTLAGVINGGTHGSNKDIGILADLVQEIKFVLANGSLATASRTKNPDLFACRTGMGAFGIMYEVLIEAVPKFHLVLTNEYFSQNQINGNTMPNRVASNPYIEWWWFPGSLFATNYWQQIVRIPNSSTTDLTGVNQGCLQLHGYNNPVSPPGCIDRSYISMTDEEPYHYWEMENFIAASDAPAAVNEINAYMDTIIAKYDPNDPRLRRRLDSHWLGARFVKGNNGDNWLAGNYMRDSCIISYGFYSYCAYEQIPLDNVTQCPNGTLSPNMVFAPISETYFDDWPFYEEIMRHIQRILAKYQGRPHWGKLHFHNARDLKTLYPKWNDFQKLRKQLDPNGLFMNAWLETLFEFDVDLPVPCSANSLLMSSTIFVGFLVILAQFL